MVLGTIQLGATKRPQGKSLPSAKPRGFFYGGGVQALERRNNGQRHRRNSMFGLNSLLFGVPVSLKSSRVLFPRQAPNYSRHYSTSPTEKKGTHYETHPTFARKVCSC